MVWLWDNAMTLATLFMAGAAAVALIYAHLQIAEGRRAEHQANANELWRENLRLAFDNPKLSDPTLNLAAFDYENCTIDGSAELFQQYEIFVDTILNASDEILAVTPTKEWEASVRIQLLPHRGYLQSLHYRNSGYLEQYTPRFRTFLAETLKEPERSTTPRVKLARIDTPNRRAKKRA